MKPELEWWEDYALGDRFATGAHAVTADDIDTFGRLTGDLHPLHMSDDYAARTRFGRRIAHGMLTLAIGAALPFREGRSILPRSFIGFYGMDRVRMTGAVHPGDAIALHGQVSEVQERGAHEGLVALALEVVNQAEAPVCTLVAKFLCGRRPPDA